MFIEFVENYWETASPQVINFFDKFVKQAAKEEIRESDCEVDDWTDSRFFRSKPILIKKFVSTLQDKWLEKQSLWASFWSFFYENFYGRGINDVSEELYKESESIGRELALAVLRATERNKAQKQRQNFPALRLKHMGRDKKEQIEKNNPAMDFLNSRLTEMKNKRSDK